ncbi:unnamed protein product, partial [Cyprideis torosa]
MVIVVAPLVLGQGDHEVTLRLMLGFMCITMFMSMWISNTATTAVMIPVVEAVLWELYKPTEESGKNAGKNPSREIPSGLSMVDSEMDNVHTGPAEDVVVASENIRAFKRARNIILCSVAYSANIGGTGSLTGTGPNLVLKGILDDHFNHATPLNFASWLMFNVPGMLICVFLAWAFLLLQNGPLQKFCYGRPVASVANARTTEETNDAGDRSKNARNILRKKYEDLGPITFHEAA